MHRRKKNKKEFWVLLDRIKCWMGGGDFLVYGEVRDQEFCLLILKMEYFIALKKGK